MCPSELSILISGDIKRCVLIGLARYVVAHAEQEIEPTTIKEIAVRSDWIGLQSPRLDTVSGPARRPITAAELLGDKSKHFGRVSINAGVRADQGVPVNRSPE